MIHPSKVLKEIGLHAIKSFGQNFLTTQSALEGLEKHLDPHNVVLEIGPGLGAITEFLVQKQFSVIVIEKDKKLAQYLEQNLARSFQTSLKVYQDDFLKLSPEFFIEKKIAQIMGNLPFYITSDIIVKIIKELSSVEVFIMGIQKEVGQRLLKGMGNSLALFVKSQGDLVDHRIIGKNNFFPVPDVDAMWLVWKRNQKISDVENFELFLRGLFWGKRKNIYSALTKNPFFKEREITAPWLIKAREFSESLQKLRADQLPFEDLMEIFLQLSR